MVQKPKQQGDMYMVTTAVTTRVKTNGKKNIKIIVTTTNEPSAEAISNAASFLKSLCKNA